MTLPADHPLRSILADEVHARPHAPIRTPAVVSAFALIDASAAQCIEHLQQLARTANVAPPLATASHYLVALGRDVLKWERHGEFVTFTVVRALDPQTIPVAAIQAAFTDAAIEVPNALDSLDADWLARLPGRTIAATDILIVNGGVHADWLEQIGHGFGHDALAGVKVLDNAATVMTDFRVRANNRMLWLLFDRALSAAQVGRTVQRLAEIEIYRMMALLAFPVAREVLPRIDALARELAHITATTAALQPTSSAPAAHAEERGMLDALTRIAAEVEQSLATHSFRFSAAQAYWDLVRARVGELREQRIGDLRTLDGFLSRRLAPAMSSCAVAARRQEELSARIERASALLRTRVDVAREEQNQRVLAAMDRRGKLQLRLQQTVEGLSVAAITYYAVGLIAHIALPISAMWPALAAGWITAAAVPLVAFGVWRGVRRLHRSIQRETELTRTPNA